MTPQTIAVIGANGKTGSRVNQRLVELGYNTRPLSRQTTPAFNWDHPETWFQALKGVHSAYITYQPDLAIPRAENDIKQLIAHAKLAGVKHLVLLSGRGEEGAKNAEDQVQKSGLNWNIVRASWFMQNFSESFMLDGILDRHLVLPRASATEPFIDTDDIADIVVATLTQPALQNELFEVTGPELLKFQSCIDHISGAIQEQVQYESIPIESYLSVAQENGMPDDIAWLMKELFTEVLDGRNEFVTDTVERVLGRPPKSFSSYVSDVTKSGIWNQ